MQGFSFHQQGHQPMGQTLLIFVGFSAHFPQFAISYQGQKNPVNQLLNLKPIQNNLGILTVDVLYVENSFFL